MHKEDCSKCILKVIKCYLISSAFSSCPRASIQTPFSQISRTLHWTHSKGLQFQFYNLSTVLKNDLIVMLHQICPVASCICAPQYCVCSHSIAHYFMTAPIKLIKWPPHYCKCFMELIAKITELLWISRCCFLHSWSDVSHLPSEYLLEGGSWTKVYLIHYWHAVSTRALMSWEFIWKSLLTQHSD